MKKLLVGLAFAAGLLSACAEDMTLSQGDDLVAAVAQACDGDVITLGTGLYEVAAPKDASLAAIIVTNGVTIVGETGNPADVIIRNTKGNITKDSANGDGAYRVFLVKNENAVLSGLTIEGGKVGDGDAKGANVRIASAGGTVTNCIIRNSIIYGNSGWPKTGASAAISCESAKGLVTHCVITNNFATRAWPTSERISNYSSGGAAAVHITLGVIRDSLIAYNSTKNDYIASIVHISGSKTLMENCTIAGNYSEDDNGNFYPVMVFPQSTGTDQNPIIRNTLIYKNVGVSGSKKLFADAWMDIYSDMIGKGYVQFVNCATDCTLPDGLTMITSGISLKTDLTENPNSTTVDAGAEMQSPVDLDLAGNPRVVNDVVDIGCYEFKPKEGAVEDPLFAPESGTEFYPSIEVALTCATAGAMIYYTTEADAEPTIEYAGAITLDDSATIRAFARKDGLDDSAVVSATYARVEPQKPVLGLVKVVPGAGRATISGTIASVGNLGATACDVYLSVDGGEDKLIAEGVAESFRYTLTDLKMTTDYTYTLTVRNNAPFAQSVSTTGSFRTKSDVDPFDYCVSETGSDENDGTTRETAFASIAKAVEVAENGNLIWVLKGTYEVSSAISVTKAITIAGEPGDPAEVVVRNTAGSAVTRETMGNTEGDHRVFVVNNAKAVLSGLTAEGGRLGSQGTVVGGNVMIDTNGGTVTNCILRNAIICGMNPGNDYPKTGASGAGIACCSKDGLVTHCVITNNFLNRGFQMADQGWGNGAAGVHINNGGVLRESLIAYNAIGGDPKGVAVFIDSPGTLIENCTIANNSSACDKFNALSFKPAAWNVGEGQNPLFRNTLVFGNGQTLFTDDWIAAQTDPEHAKKMENAYSRFTSCATDAAIPEGLEGKVIHGEEVKVTSRFSPTPSSSLVDAGAAMQSPVDLDLAGKQRIYGAAVDIGCYEYIRSGISILAR